MEDRLEQPVAFPVGTAVKLVIGAFFIVLGILITLDNLDLFYADGILRLWPLVLVVIGALKVAGRCGVVFGTILMIAGASMTAFNLGWINFTIFDLWPLLLIGFGLTMVSRAFEWKRPHIAWPRTPHRMRGGTTGASSWAILSSRNVVETSQEYSGSDVLAFLGGCRIDLTGARFAAGGAVIDATAIMGGVEIIVPDDCEVIGEVVPVMGGFEIKSQSSGSRSAGRLVVRGVALMGGIEVKSAGRTA